MIVVFVSMFFLGFLGIVVTSFFVLPVKWRPYVLLFASYVFCGFLDLRALAVLILVSFCTWRTGVRIERYGTKGLDRAGKRSMVWVIFLYVFLLCVYKYMPGLLEITGLEQQMPKGFVSSFAMPVGLSFYLFQAIGYLVDIYKKKEKAEKSFLCLSCYFAFFPKLVSGPIERERGFLDQFKKIGRVKFWDRGRLSTAFTYMLWGYFMKMVVADRLAATVNQIFADPNEFDSLWLVLGALFYTMQIYCDFAGYSYIAIGCGKVFGINLTHNFESPYCAGTISGFWRRWHISLSTWLRDYLYIPLGGNRKGNFRKCVNTMLVFLVCGMWHGAGLNFVVWGLLHGLYSVTEVLWRKTGRKMRGGRILTFCAVAFAWIFFRAENLKAASDYVAGMFTTGIKPGMWYPAIQALGLNTVEAVVIVFGIAVVWAIDRLCNKRQMHLPVLIQYKENAARYFVFYLLIIAILIFGVYGPGYHAEQFIYMQF